MSARIRALLCLGLLAGVLGTGCGKGTSEERTVEIRRQITPVQPTVRGHSREMSIDGDLAHATGLAESVLKGAEVRISERRKYDQGVWLLGESQAGRHVLMEVLPVYPQRCVIRVTVEGADLVSRELLERLVRDIERPIR